MRRVTPFAVLVGSLAAAHAAPGGADARSVQLLVESALGGLGTRVEVSVGEIDPHGRLAPCARMEPFLPAGARVWGRTLVGVRCVEGAAWTTTVPVHVRVWGPAVVAARPLAAGETVTPESVAVEEVELTREPPGLLPDPAQATGKVLLRAVGAGQPLRREALRAPLVVGQGDTVKLVYRGEGFTVTMDARALAAAADGQSVRVQTPSGRVVTGIARAGRVVEMNL